MNRRALIIGTAAVTAGLFLLALGIVLDANNGIRVSIIVAGLLLLIFGCWVLMIALRPHPFMRRHKVIRLSIPDIEARARAGAPFDLPLGDTPLEIVVQPAPVMVEGAPVITARAGEEIARSPAAGAEAITTFAGKVSGAKNSEVRLTITDLWIRGYVLTDDTWWFIEPLRKFRPEADFDEYIAYRTRDLRFRLPYGEDGRRSGDEGNAQGGGTNPPHRVNPIVPIAMITDEIYHHQTEGRPMDFHRALINEVNGIYSQLDCEFRISVTIFTVGWLTSSNPDRMLEQVEAVVRAAWTNLRLVANRRSFNTEVAHATTGRMLDEGTLGIGHIDGVYSLSKQQLSWLGGGGFLNDGPNLALQNMLVVAHELGHNFNGVHQEADEWCTFHFIFCWSGACSVMWPFIRNDNDAHFSDGGRDPSHNNRRRISDNMASGRNRNY